VDNCLRCLPPKIKDSQYPIGDERKAAEAHCRIYDRWNEFKPSVNLIQIHPAAIAREPSPLPLFVKTFEKSKHFHLGGERPLVLCGGKAVQMWLGYGSTIQSWLGHYASETFFSASNRERRRVEGMAIKVGEKKVRKKKLTIRGVLEEIVKATVPFQVQTGDVVGQEVTVRWTEEEYKEIAALFVSKVKKV
jgi:hypothetical protein